MSIVNFLNCGSIITHEHNGRCLGRISLARAKLFNKDAREKLNDPWVTQQVAKAPAEAGWWQE